MIRRLTITRQDKDALAKLKIDPEDLKDDFYDYSKVVVKKPWGYEYLLFANESIAVWILYVRCDAQTSMHCHTSKKTSLVVLQGHVVCSTITEELERSPGEGLLIEKGVFHQTKAMSESGAFVMEIETPVNKRELVRLKDQYGREGQGYESIAHYSGNTQNYNYLSLNKAQVENYNLKKRFGHCTLTCKRVKVLGELLEIIRLNPDDVITVLGGEVLDEKDTPLAGIGDTIAIKELASPRGLMVRIPVELLIIKKIDHLIKVSDYVADFLEQTGIKKVFMVPGESNVHLLDSIGRHEGLDFICNQAEKSASFAAEGYAKLSSELSVLVISSGSSVLNVVPGVGNAWIDSTPVLVISGQTRTDQYSDGTPRQLDNKSLNIIDIVTSITKYAVRITDPTKIRFHLEKAVHLATEGRPGPVWIDLPIDIQGMTIDANDLKPFTGGAEPPIARVNTADILAVRKLLREAQRPVLLAGNGIRLSKAEDEFLELVNRIKVPVLTSRRGADLLPEDHPYFFGRPGVYGQRRANFVIQNADLLISIGSRLSIPLIGRNTGAFARAAKKIVVDIDERELKKDTINPDLTLHMSAKDFVSVMLKDMSDHVGDYSAWLCRCREWLEQFIPLGRDWNQADRVMPHIFVAALAEKMQDNDVIVVDGGSPVSCMMQSFRFKRGQRMISSTGLELHGFAVAGAIGVSIAMGRGQVLCLCEDRGFQVSVPELQTIADYQLPVKIFVLKSKVNSNIRKIQRDYFGERYVGTDREMLLGSPALCEIAKAYNFAIFEISRSEEIGRRIRETLDYKGPAICEVHVEDDQDILPRIGFTVKEDGKWIARPLEDMYPYLDRQTLKENMIIDLLPED